MAVSHFTLPVCPNPACPSNQNASPPPRRETAVGDPVGQRWHCFECERSGSIMYVIDGGPTEEPLSAA